MIKIKVGMKVKILPWDLDNLPEEYVPDMELCIGQVGEVVTVGGFIGIEDRSCIEVDLGDSELPWSWLCEHLEVQI